MNYRRMGRDEAETLRRSIIDLNLLVQQQSRMSAKQNRAKFERRLKATKMKMIATDSIIRKVRAGEIEISQIKEEVRGSRQEHKKSTKNFIRQLELLTLPLPPVPIQRELILPPDVPEPERKILILNQKIQMDTLKKEARLLMDIVFDKKIQHEHNQYLRKEYKKIKNRMKSPIINYNIYL